MVPPVTARTTALPPPTRYSLLHAERLLKPTAPLLVLRLTLQSHDATGRRGPAVIRAVPVLGVRHQVWHEYATHPAPPAQLPAAFGPFHTHDELLAAGYRFVRSESESSVVFVEDGELCDELWLDLGGPFVERRAGDSLSHFTVVLDRIVSAVDRPRAEHEMRRLAVRAAERERRRWAARLSPEVGGAAAGA